jgi:hypothetical protein
MYRFPCWLIYGSKACVNRCCKYINTRCLDYKQDTCDRQVASAARRWSTLRIAVTSRVSRWKTECTTEQRDLLSETHFESPSMSVCLSRFSTLGLDLIALSTVSIVTLFLFLFLSFSFPLLFFPFLSLLLLCCYCYSTMTLNYVGAAVT